MDLNSSFASRMVREELAAMNKKEKDSAGCASKTPDNGCKHAIRVETVRSSWVRLMAKTKAGCVLAEFFTTK